MDRYSRNKSMITEDEQEKLRASKVCVLGCGGLGGNIIEMLARLGVGTITAVDGDNFDESNLNRQILSNSDTIGLPKAEVAKSRISIVNSEVELISIVDFINQDNGVEILRGHDIIVDALDSIEIRMQVVDMCKELDLPYVYGAIAGWYGQVATILPGDETLSALYKSKKNKGAETKLGNPSFTPAFVAALQVSEVLKLVTGKGDILRHSFLHIDMLTHEYEVFEL